ncbi:apolipoprotein N-acyltransferase [Rickettsiales bacterium]|nr:apolipoprotein N-acyltransferase [Rickettsiales bacterium]
MKFIVNYQKTCLFILGLLTALLFAPIGFFPIGFLAFSVLLILLDGRRVKNAREAFYLGWFFAFGHFAAGLYWISISLFVDIAQFWWLLPFSLSLIPAALALYVALCCYFYCKIIDKFAIKDKIIKIFLFACLWIIFEILRSILFSGLPWNLLGYSLFFWNLMPQIASKIGIYGLSFVAIIFFTIPYFCYKNDFTKLKNKIYLLFCAILLIFIVIFGHLQINSGNKQLKSIKIRLIQPNIKQEDKWSKEERYNSFLKNITYSRGDFDNREGQKPDYIIWSEASTPYVLGNENKFLLNKISEAIPKGSKLITGALRAGYDKDNKLKQIWNSLFVINSDAKIINFYDKSHLVPFGEYIPLSQFLPFLSKITYGSLDFSSGGGNKTIQLSDDISFSPLICYEIIFPWKVFDHDNKPDFIINITNDAWFGVSSGPYQHLNMARMRAIENQIPVIRVANSGVTAIIDKNGQIIKKIDLGQEGRLDFELKF